VAVKSEREVLQCIFGAKQNETWRRRYNYELHETFKEPNIVNYIKLKRLAWAGHLVHMNNKKKKKTNIQHQTRWSKKSWKTEIAMGRWC
jgi:hypothetical protein